MEHTKGEMIAEPKASELENLNPRFSIGIKNGEILFTSTLHNALKNTHRLLLCWNNYEATARHRDKLLAACKKANTEIIAAIELPTDKRLEKDKDNLIYVIRDMLARINKAQQELKAAIEDK